jgi:hypothetical protein
LPEPLGGGGEGGGGDDVGALEDCVEPEDVFDVELLFEPDDGEFLEGVPDGVPVLCEADEPPVDEPELVVDVCAKA